MSTNDIAPTTEPSKKDDEKGLDWTKSRKDLTSTGEEEAKHPTAPKSQYYKATQGNNDMSTDDSAQITKPPKLSHDDDDDDFKNEENGLTWTVMTHHDQFKYCDDTNKDVDCTTSGKELNGAVDEPKHTTPPTTQCKQAKPSTQKSNDMLTENTAPTTESTKRSDDDADKRVDLQKRENGQFSPLEEQDSATYHEFKYCDDTNKDVDCTTSGKELNGAVEEPKHTTPPTTQCKQAKPSTQKSNDMLTENTAPTTESTKRSDDDADKRVDLQKRENGQFSPLEEQDSATYHEFKYYDDTNKDADCTTSGKELNGAVDEPKHTTPPTTQCKQAKPSTQKSNDMLTENTAPTTESTKRSDDDTDKRVDLQKRENGQFSPLEEQDSATYHEFKYCDDTNKDVDCTTSGKELNGAVDEPKHTTPPTTQCKQAKPSTQKSNDMLTENTAPTTESTKRSDDDTDKRVDLQKRENGQFSPLEEQDSATYHEFKYCDDTNKDVDCTTSGKELNGAVEEPKHTTPPTIQCKQAKPSTQKSNDMLTENTAPTTESTKRSDDDADKRVDLQKRENGQFSPLEEQDSATYHEFKYCDDTNKDVDCTTSGKELNGAVEEPKHTTPPTTQCKQAKPSTQKSNDMLTENTAPTTESTKRSDDDTDKRVDLQKRENGLFSPLEEQDSATYHEFKINPDGSTIESGRKDSSNNLPVNLLLVGMAGHGKSSTGNSIVGHDVFEVGRCAQTVTHKLKGMTIVRPDRNVNVVDTPPLDEPDARDAIKRFITKSKYQTILVLVIGTTGTRYNTGMQRCLTEMGDLFESTPVRCILLTGIKDKQDSDLYLQDVDKSGFMTVIKKFGGRKNIHILENEGACKPERVKKFLNKILIEMGKRNTSNSKKCVCF